ncbi:MAG: CopD family protein [Candidatus Rokubacteria bacterium]|nr:CopD family protein [Candidatus Rokubacteria bacterium]
MTLLAGFLDVLLRGLALVALSASVGGVGYALWALRPLGRRRPPVEAAARRALGLIIAGALVLAAARLVILTVLQPWALADETGGWALREVLSTAFARAGLVSVVLALGLAVCAAWLRAHPTSPAGWMVAVAISLVLLGNAAWLAHATSRLEGRAPLMAMTVVHQAGAVIWVGGLIHLMGFWRLRGSWRLSPGDEAADRLGAAVLGRFSALALFGVALVVGPGLFLMRHYVGGWEALIGTGYGFMVVTKVALLGAALLLGALNFLVLRRRTGGGPAGDATARLRAFVEAELGIGLTVLLSAASLTSLPPGIDVVADRATPAEVAARFLPGMPRLTSPPVGQLLAAAAPIADTLGIRQPEEYAWSEYNHHAAGMFVFAMGVLAVLDRTGRPRWARHWPLLFLGLAAFMFIRNDPRAWPLGPAGFWESMTLPDVLQHRLAVLFVVAIGLFEWLGRIGPLRRPGWQLVFPLLCAAGGAVLLTHSHAMFNLKAEFLAEVSHAPMGLLAVLMGWGRWIELRLPEGTNGVPGWVWAVSMVLIGALLLVYRET